MVKIELAPKITLDAVCKHNAYEVKLIRQLDSSQTGHQFAQTWQHWLAQTTRQNLSLS